jgi:hypothetical protein
MKIQGYEVTTHQEAALVSFILRQENSFYHRTVDEFARELGVPEFHKRSGCFETHCSYRVADALLRRLKKADRIRLTNNGWKVNK